jgi:regulator of replication initiation timing
MWSKVNAIQKSLENLALTCYEMRQRIVTLVEENWSLKAELTNTVPRSKYQALKTLYDEAETQVKLIADSKQTENLIQQDQLSLSQENINKPPATIQVSLYSCCWFFQV